MSNKAQDVIQQFRQSPISTQREIAIAILEYQFGRDVAARSRPSRVAEIAGRYRPEPAQDAKPLDQWFAAGTMSIGRAGGPIGRSIIAPPRACGGIGRRARLRALSGFYRVEVRVLSGALKNPATAGFLIFGLWQLARKLVGVIPAVIPNEFAVKGVKTRFQRRIGVLTPFTVRPTASVPEMESPSGSGPI